MSTPEYPLAGKRVLIMSPRFLATRTRLPMPPERWGAYHRCAGQTVKHDLDEGSHARFPIRGSIADDGVCQIDAGSLWISRF